MQLAIRTIDLNRRFGRRTAVGGLDLAVPKGLVTGFLGPNGSGKTTTIRMLLGLLRADSGTIEILGQSIPERRIAVARKIGAMVETPCHYDHLSGRENLRVTACLLGVDWRAIDAALERVGLCHAARQRVGGYSLGMRQRLGIARALLGRPEVLILDEPVNSLDPEGIIEMRQLIRSLAHDHGMTILVSSHLLPEVEQTADHVALIAHGRMVVQGPLSEILGRSAATILVRPSQPAGAARMLRAKGLCVDHDSGGRLSVVRSSGIEAAQIARLLYDSGFAIHELGEKQPTLEQIYLGLTQKREAA